MNLNLSEQGAYEIGIEAYQYLYPLVTMDVTRRVMTNVPAGVKPGFGPMGSFQHMRTFPTAEFRQVVRPNFDTLYSSAWLDLTREPVIVSVSDTHDRYFLLPMLDMWTDVFAAPGKRTTGTGAQIYVVVPPGWAGTLPTGLERIDAPTRYVWVIGRIQTNGTKDYPAVHKVQDGLLVTPLSQRGKPPVSPRHAVDRAIDMKTPPVTQVTNMPAAKYFAYGAELMKNHPPHVADWSILARLKHIGIVQGQTFEWNNLRDDVQSALERAAVDALKQMTAKAPTIARVVNGWQMNTDTMGVYGDFYLKRAIVALIGLGANMPEDAIYPFNVADAEGKPVTATNSYVIHFRKDEIPPAGAFWSITMYDAEGFQVANELNRFAIGDRDDLQFNADGSLDIYIQHTSPGKDLESNWLPSPDHGQLGLTMRLYAPKAPALNGQWAPPPVKKAA